MSTPAYRIRLISNKEDVPARCVPGVVHGLLTAQAVAAAELRQDPVYWLAVVTAAATGNHALNVWREDE